MNKISRITGAFLLAFNAATAIAQPTPTITGEDTICPQSVTTWSCDVPYDSYQWYQRTYGTNDTVPIPGATSQTLTLEYAEAAGSSILVEGTENGNSFVSPEFFVHGRNFSGISAASLGSFDFGNQGQMIICSGEMIYLRINMPYNTNISWYNNSVEIPGQINDTLIVTGAGSYTVSGAPSSCPDFVQTMLISMDVEMGNCSIVGMDENELTHAAIYPNPATEQMTVSHPSDLIEKIEMRSTTGQLVHVTAVNQLSATIAADDLHPGTYFVTIYYSDRSEVVPVTIQ